MEQELQTVETKPERLRADPNGRKFYGRDFTTYNKVSEVADLIASFKDYYYERKIANPNETLKTIACDFNKIVCQPLDRQFYPYMNQLYAWKKKWDLDITQQVKNKDMVVTSEKNIYQLIKTRNERGDLLDNSVDYENLESGMKTLGGELVNDALQMLRDDQLNEDVMDEQVVVKRRTYIVNVFGYVTRLVQARASLMLKASQEKRETAGFLMSMLARASSGEMSEEELNLLKTSYAPKTNEGQ